MKISGAELRAASQLLRPSRRVLLFLAVALTMTAAYGQPANPGPPPGGYALKRVKFLEAVPEPPGGLVPYRAGELWGYCDTLGRVWIKPSWSQPPTFFARGFANVLFAEREFGKVLTPGQWVNARGEYVLMDGRYAAIQRPDGRVERVARRRNSTGKELTAVYRSADGRTDSLVERSAFPPARWLRSKHYSEVDSGIYSTEFRFFWWLSALSHVLRPRPLGVGRGAPWTEILVDSRGHRLSRRRYAKIDSYHNGVGLTYRDGYNYLNRQGQPLLAADVKKASDFRSGRAVVHWESYESPPRDSSRWALIDTAGRRRFESSWDWELEGPDGQGWIIQKDSPFRLPDTPVPVVKVRYRDANGKEPFAPNRFDQADLFRDHRATVRIGTRVGLINRRGEWVTKEPYEEVRGFFGESSYSNRGSSFLAVAHREHCVGIVSCQTGRELVPLIYDQLISSPLPDLFILRRDGEMYLVDSTGRERWHAQIILPMAYVDILYQRPTRFSAYQSYRADGLWCVRDSSGHRRTRWLPPVRQCLAYNFDAGTVFVRKGNMTGSVIALLDSTGQELLYVRHRPAPWLVKMEGEALLVAYASQPTDSTRLRTPTVTLYNLRGQQVGPKLYARAEESSANWLLLADLDQPGSVPNKFDGVCWNCRLNLLRSPNGKQFEAPAPYEWDDTNENSRYQRPFVPFGRGIQAVRRTGINGWDRQLAGYVTRGGRKLFADKATGNF